MDRRELKKEYVMYLYEHNLMHLDCEGLFEMVEYFYRLHENEPGVSISANYDIADDISQLKEIEERKKLAESEDERIRKFLVDYFASYKIGNVTTKLNGVRIDDILNYLEKQKEQKPASWSEEDEDMLNSCISSIEEAKENRYAYKETDGDTSYDHEIAWLKSLRNRVGKEFLQPHWKPSEEQPDFPITDEQIKEFLATHPKVEVPEKYKTPDFVFKKQEQPEIFDTVAFQKGVQEGRRLEREDAKSTIQSRIDEILGDAQPAPILRMELQELIKKIEL